MKVKVLFVLTVAMGGTLFAQTPLGDVLMGENGESEFGYFISLSEDGNRMIVFDPLYFDTITLARGRVQLFEYTNGEWLQIGMGLTQPDATFLRSTDLSADGRKVALAYEKQVEEGPHQTHIQVLEYTEGGWERISSPIILDEAYVGNQVKSSGNGDRVAISAVNDMPGDLGQSHLLVYEYDDENWVQLGQTISISGEIEDPPDFFQSFALSSDGTRIAAGTQFSALEGGSVKVYEYQANNEWVPLGMSITPEITGTWFGHDIALNMDGDRLAVSAPGEGESRGAVRVYEYDNMNWTQLGSAILGEEDFELAGWAIDLSSDGSRIVLGFPGAITSSGFYSGAIAAFQYTGSDWNELGMRMPGAMMSDGFGDEVAISGDGQRMSGGAFLGIDSYVQVFDLSLLSSLSSFPYYGPSTMAYPNPTKDVVFLEGTTGKRYCLFGSDGQLVGKGIVNNGQISLASLSNGIYWLQLEGGGILKIVRQ